MRNIRLTIEYDGTRFFGWQVQDSTKHRFRTVQGEIEKAGQRLFGKRIRLIGAGRTDSGVHAEAQAANFRIDTGLSLDNILKGINKYLPKDIAIISVEDTEPDFHSQFNAKEKLYRYRILNRGVRSPLLSRYSAFVSYNLNIRAMREGCKYLIGRKDFKSFQSSIKKERSSVRTIKRLDIIKKGDLIEIYIQADGFLYNMARNITGTLIEVGRRKLSPGDIKDILAERCRKKAGPTAPAKGLCLAKVFY